MRNDRNQPLTTLQNIEDRLAETLLLLRMTKLKQIVGRTGYALNEVLLIKKLPRGWRIEPVSPFPLKAREVETLLIKIRATHYRIG